MLVHCLDILTEFAKRNVNLTFIQSRPTGLELGHYHFIIDAEGHIADAPVKEAVESLRAICEDIRFLGSYPREKASKMIDIKFIRENPDVVRASQTGRGEDDSIVDKVLAIDEVRRSRD